ncbi:MAG TPA: hypothetical protein VHJ20_00865 [Polyangia bacterium]|nr:hypothetical protein [Polyangia bacterium]
MTRQDKVAIVGLIALTVSLVVALLVAGPAHAQEVNLARIDDGPANRVYVRTGAEWAFVAGVGYARTTSIGRHPVLVVGELTAPWAAPETSDYQARVGALAPILGWGGFKLAASFEPTLRGTRNDLGRMTSLGADAGLTGGYYARGWFLACEFGFDYALTTHIAHSELYRDNVYAGARDGWYINPGGNFRLGGQAGLSFSRFDVVARAGILRDMEGGAPLFPLYATVALVTAW